MYIYIYVYMYIFLYILIYIFLFLLNALPAFAATLRVLSSYLFMLHVVWIAILPKILYFVSAGENCSDTLTDPFAIGRALLHALLTEPDLEGQQKHLRMVQHHSEFYKKLAPEETLASVIVNMCKQYSCIDNVKTQTKLPVYNWQPPQHFAIGPGLCLQSTQAPHPLTSLTSGCFAMA